jgi:hypothetical protein
MAGGWTRARFEQHRSRYPREERALRNRAAQARYRRRYADERARVRRVANLLGHRLRLRDAAFVADLARAIRDCLDDDVARRLGAALSAGRRPPASRRRRR